MTQPAAADLLAVWEAGVSRAAFARADLLHRVARDGAEEGPLLELPVGARETDLLALRRTLFGERMQVRLECSACAESMEFDLDAGAFAEQFGERPAPRAALTVSAEGWEVDFRLPSLTDLTAAVSVAAGGGDARLALLERLVDSALRDGSPAPVSQLPPSVRQKVAQAAEEADPAADMALAVACPECGEHTRAELDIASFLWTELDAWARDVLLDVHLLASAYGWSEPQILALSPLRRRYYLELCADA